MTSLGIAVLALRGAAAIVALTWLVGGMPRVVRAALAVALGLWSALAVAPALTTPAPGGPIVAAPFDPSWQLALAELAIGAALGVVAAIPLLAAAAAGRLVDVAGTGRVGGAYGPMFGILAAAVFVGIDGHVAVIEAVVHSHRTAPVLAMTRDGVLSELAHLVPAAIRLAVPWLVTAAVVQVAAGVGLRLAGRASAHVPSATAVPAALVMMTAALVATLAVAMAALMRGAL